MTAAAEETPIVHVIDDDPSVRAAIDDLLASVGLPARLHGSASQFFDAPLDDRPCCLVLDVRMPGLSGLELQRRLASQGRHHPIVLVTGHGDIAMSVRAMKAGAIEFLTKPFDDQELLDAIHRGIEMDRERRRAEARLLKLRERFETLAPGEKAVMSLVVRGMLNKQVAAELGISEITVKVRRRQVMLKMGAPTLPDLVRMADAIGGGAFFTAPRG